VSGDLNSSETLERLNETLRRARRSSPYYVEALKDVALPLQTLGDLGRLPLLTRETVVERRWDLLAVDSIPVAVGMSGGTTAASGGPGQPVLTFRDEVEAAASRALIEASYGEGRPRPLILHLVNLGHGYDPAAAIPGVFQMAVDRPFHVDAVLAVLGHTFTLPGFTGRVNAMVGALRLLKALTLVTMERGLDGRDFAVHLVSSSSNHLTSRWRAILERFWEASVDETYGLSEVPGFHAARCASCGHFHFGPHALVEVLGISNDEPVEQGAGRLVATSLYPLASMQPMIRYDTDDIVELTGACPAAGRVGFEFLGRRPDLVVAEGSEGPRVLLSPVTVHEVLDDVPDVATEQYAFARALGLRTGVGFQRWAVHHRPGEREVRLGVELRWSPREHDAGPLQRELRRAVLAAAPVLAEAVAGGEVGFEVDLYEPGSTDFKALV